MKEVFVDTHYWIAIVRPNDSWRASAVQARNEIGPCRLVSSDEVLSEFLSGLSKGSAKIRATATAVVRTILASAEVEVVPQSHAGFMDAVDFYQSRADKRYSLVDCRSMQIMKSRGILEVLSNDQHFQQEGFQVLIRDQS